MLQHDTKTASAETAPPGASRTPWLIGPLTGRGAWVAALILACDQASKLYLLYVFHLGDLNAYSVGPFIDFVLTWNTGISYGLLQQSTALGRWLLLGFTAAAVVLLWIWLARAPSRLTALALGLIIGGAVGNAIDRFAYGAVVDFVLLHATFGGKEFRWFVFNLADAAIVAGVIGLLYESMFSRAAAKAP